MPVAACFPVADGERSDPRTIHPNTPGVTLSKTITALDAAKAVYTEAVEAFQAANASYLESIDAANAQIIELNRLDAAIKAGDSSVAGQRIAVKARVSDLTEVAEAHNQAVLVSIRRRDAAYANVVTERLRASVGSMKSMPAIRELELEARAQVDEILFALADKIKAHNTELTSTVDAVVSAHGTFNRSGAVEARKDSNGSVLIVDGVEYREHAASFVVGNAVGYPADRWAEDRNADELAARRAEAEHRSAEDARLANERSDAIWGMHQAEARATRA